MNKSDLALLIAKKITKGQSKIQSFNSYECIKSYFNVISLAESKQIALQYGIKISNDNYISE